MTDKKRTDAPGTQADIEIGAAAKARKLRFKRKPEAEVRFPGSAEDRSGSHTERENLPDEVEPGVTYRDVKVRWRAGASLSGRLLPHEETAADAKEGDDE